MTYHVPSLSGLPHAPHQPVIAGGTPDARHLGLSFRAPGPRWYEGRTSHRRPTRGTWALVPAPLDPGGARDERATGAGRDATIPHNGAYHARPPPGAASAAKIDELLRLSMNSSECNQIGMCLSRHLHLPFLVSHLVLSCHSGGAHGALPPPRGTTGLWLHCLCRLFYWCGAPHLFWRGPW